MRTFIQSTSPAVTCTSNSPHMFQLSICWFRVDFLDQQLFYIYFIGTALNVLYQRRKAHEHVLYMLTYTPTFRSEDLLPLYNRLVVCAHLSTVCGTCIYYLQHFTWA